MAGGQFVNSHGSVLVKLVIRFAPLNSERCHAGFDKLPTLNSRVLGIEPISASNIS